MGAKFSLFLVAALLLAAPVCAAEAPFDREAAARVARRVAGAIRDELRLRRKLDSRPFYERLARLGLEPSAPDLKAFETAVLETYLAHREQSDRVSALATLLELDVDEAYRFLLGYDLDDWFQHHVEAMLRELAKLSPDLGRWQRALWARSRLLERLFPTEAVRLRAATVPIPEATWLALLGDDEETTLAQDPLLVLELLRSGLDRSARPDVWVNEQRAKVAHLYGALVERRLLANVSDLVPGAVIRVGGLRHADGWQIVRVDGGFLLDRFYEVKASPLGYLRAQEQGLSFFERLLEPESTVHVFGMPLGEDSLRLRTKGGTETLASLRHRWAALRNGDDESGLREFLAETFPDDFFVMRIPGLEKADPPAFGKLESVDVARAALLRDLHRWLRAILPTLEEGAVLGLWKENRAPLRRWSRWLLASASVQVGARVKARTLSAAERRFVEPGGALAAMQAWAKEKLGVGLTYASPEPFFRWLLEASGGTAPWTESVAGVWGRPVTWHGNTVANAFRGHVGPTRLVLETWESLVQDWNRRHEGRAIEGVNGALDALAWHAAVAAWDLEKRASELRLERGVDDPTTEAFVAARGGFPAMNEWADEHWRGSLRQSSRAREFFDWLVTVTGCTAELPMHASRKLGGRRSGWQQYTGTTALEGLPGPALIVREAWDVVVSDWNRRHPEKALGEGDAGRYGKAAWDAAVAAWDLEAQAKRLEEEEGRADPDAARFVGETGALRAMHRWASAHWSQGLIKDGAMRKFLLWLVAKTESGIELPQSAAGGGNWEGRAIGWSATIATRALAGLFGPSRLLKESWRAIVLDWNARHPDRTIGTDGALFDEEHWNQAVKVWALEEKAGEHLVAEGQADPDALVFVRVGGAFPAMHEWAQKHWDGGLSIDGRAEAFFRWLFEETGCQAEFPLEVLGGGKSGRMALRWTQNTGVGALRGMAAARLVKEAWVRLVDDWNRRHGDRPVADGTRLVAKGWEEALERWGLADRAKRRLETRDPRAERAGRFVESGTGGFPAMHAWAEAELGRGLAIEGTARAFFVWLAEVTAFEGTLPESVAPTALGNGRTVRWSNESGARALRKDPGPSALLYETWSLLVADWNRRHGDAPVAATEDTLPDKGTWVSAVARWDLEKRARDKRVKDGREDPETTTFVDRDRGALPAMGRWMQEKGSRSLTQSGAAETLFEALRKASACEAPPVDSVPGLGRFKATGVKWGTQTGRGALAGMEGPARLLRQNWRVLVEDWNRRHGDEPEARITGDEATGIYGLAAWRQAEAAWNLAAVALPRKWSRCASRLADAGDDDAK